MEIWFKTEESSRTAEKKPKIRDIFSASYIMLTDAFIFCYWKANESSCPALCAHGLSHVWLCDPMDCSLPGSSVHGIFQARTLEWVAFPSPEDLPLAQESNLRLLHWQVYSLPLSHLRSSLLTFLLWIIRTTSLREKYRGWVSHCFVSQNHPPVCTHHTHTLLLTFALLSVAQNTRIEHSIENCELSLSLCCVVLSCFSCVWLFVTPWTIAR